MTTRLTERECLGCGGLIDAAAAPMDDNAIPSPGDVTICIHCGYLMAFADDLSYRGLTEKEMDELDLLEISRIQRARKTVMDKKPIGESVKK